MDTPSVDAVTIFANFIALLAPAIVNVIKRKWNLDGNQSALCALMVAIVIFTTLHALSGTLVYPVPLSFWIGLSSVFGTQQMLYLFLFKDRNPEPTTTTETTIVPSGAVVVTETKGNV